MGGSGIAEEAPDGPEKVVALLGIGVLGGENKALFRRFRAVIAEK